MRRMIRGLPVIIAMFIILVLSPVVFAEVTIRWATFPIWWPGITGAESQDEIAALREAGQPSTWAEFIADRFMKEYPTVKIEHVQYGWEEADALKLSLAAGVGPHVFYTYPALFGELVSAGLLAPIDDYLRPEDLEELHPEGLRIGNFKGRHYLWPWRLDPEGLWIVNRSIFERFNAVDLLPQGPDYRWTVERFLAAVRAVTRRDSEPPIYALNLEAWINNVPNGISTWPSWSFLYAFGGDLWDPATESVTPEIRNKIERTFELFYQLQFELEASGPGSFTNGNLAIEFGNGQAIRQNLLSVYGSEDSMPFEVMFVLPPSVPGVDPGVPGAVGGFAVGHHVQGEELEWAMRFARFLTEEAQQLTLGTGLPVRRTAFPDFKPGDELVQFEVNYVLPYLKPYSTHVETFRITDVWKEAAGKVISGELSPKEAADYYQHQVNIILQRR